MHTHPRGNSNIDFVAGKLETRSAHPLLGPDTKIRTKREPLGAEAKGYIINRATGHKSTKWIRYSS